MSLAKRRPVPERSRLRCLVSLKAGGVGLNLTAADYVFVLDPWWNPAVEAQAVDRAHRIGQRRPVFAYRLIAENTVEEKSLTLQPQKRELADAILVQDDPLIREFQSFRSRSYRENAGRAGSGYAGVKPWVERIWCTA